MTNLTFFVATAHKFNIYCGSVIFLAGVIGGLLNLIVFVSLRTFRESSCAFYLAIMSVVNIGQLFTGLLTRIMISGLDIDWTHTSLFYCKFRPFFLQCCVSTSFSCCCLATIDQFLATCSSRRWQKYSHIKVAACMTIVSIVVWILHGVPYLIFYEQIDSAGVLCVITSEKFKKYSNYVYAILFVGVFPVVITTIFGLLALRNVRQIAHRTVPLVRRELDKQVTMIILVQGFFNVWFLLPYIIGNSLLSNANPVAFPRLFFANSLTLLVYYFYFAVSRPRALRPDLRHLGSFRCRSGLSLYGQAPVPQNQVDPQTRR